MSKRDKSDKKANKADYQRAMDRLEDAVKDLGEAAKDNFADRAAEVLEQTAAKLKNDVSHGTRSSLGSEADEGRLGHWRGEGSERPFRDLDKGKLWGICAGIAPYLGLEPWVVRCLAITAFIFAPQIIVPAYIIGYFVLDPRSRHYDTGAGRGKRTNKREIRNERYAARTASKAEARAAKAEAKAARRARREARRALPENALRKTPAAEPELPARNLLRNVRGTLQEAEMRLRRMEGHVTSGRYELQKELRRIDPT